MKLDLERFFRDERGVTTAGMAVSMAVCLTLVFSGAQLYRTTSASAEIQEVADVAALAAENEVAEFMVAVRVSDAAVLSMTLLSCSLYGLGVVAACVPPLAALSEQVISMASKAKDARDGFAENASTGLNRLQRLLPFLSAASAASIASANDDGAMEASYTAIAVLVPQEGKEISVGTGSGLSDAAGKIEEEAPEIRDASERAEEAAKKAREKKEEAYRYDCGNSPGYCQYERAGRFSWMPESDNPYYSSVDAWSFSVALERAKSYYARRLAMEGEPVGGISEKASYHLRMKFYEYALEELERDGFVSDDGQSFSANFPKLFKNTNEFRATRLYNEAVFPVSGGESGSGALMHAFEGCPANGGTVCYRTLKDLDSGEQQGCQVCDFSVESLGNIASASTNIENGFEHHYEHIRQLAEEYQEARDELDPLSSEVRGKVEPLLEMLKSLMRDVAGFRIEAEPPGAKGSVAMVVNLAANSADAGFESSFVKSGATLGSRAAVSAATLVEDSSHENSSVVTSLLDGFENGGAAVGAARIVLDCWSAMLKAYENGQSALEDALEGGLNSIPTSTESGLGSWASEVLRSAVSAVGLEPAKLKALKPVILNTHHVTDSDDGTFSVRFRQAKASALAASSPKTDLFSAVAAEATDGLGDAAPGDSITIAEIELPVGGARIPITLAVPQSAQDASAGFLSTCIDAVGGVLGSAFAGKVWQ